MSNSTAVHVGFMPEPNCGRGTIGILWQCLTTIFLCVYTSLHLDVPPQPISFPRRMWRSFIWIVISVFIPEVVCAKALGEFFGARALVRIIKSKKLGTISTQQAHFLLSGGLRFVYPTETVLESQRVPKWIFRADPEDEKSKTLIKLAIANLPSDAAIEDRSKADILAKSLTCLQALWVATQTVARIQQHLDTSPLEVVTGAYILLAFIAYSAWFSKPYSVDTCDQVQLATELDFDFGTVIDGSKAYEMSLMTLDFAFLDLHPGVISEYEDGYFGLVSVLLFAAFTGIHCAAWNYSFPTTIESYMWRTCAILPGALAVMYFLKNSFDQLFGMKLLKLDMLLGNTLFMVCMTGFYVIGRLFVLVEIFISFRAAPQGIYQQLNWSNYVGHIGS